MSQANAKCLPRLITVAIALTASTALGGCSVDLLSKVGLEKKKPATEIAQSAAPQEMEKAQPAPNHVRAAAYVDPMVAKQESQKRPQAGLIAANDKQPAKTQVPQNMMAQASTVSDPANDLGQVVSQPTAVTASANSIYSIANAQVAAAEGVPAYAPTRNINPMAGSVFSARLPTQAPTPAQPQASTGPDSNGMY